MSTGGDNYEEIHYEDRIQNNIKKITHNSKSQYTQISLSRTRNYSPKNNTKDRNTNFFCRKQMAAGLSVSQTLTITPIPFLFFSFSLIFGCTAAMCSFSLKDEGYVPLYSVSKSVNMSPMSNATHHLIVLFLSRILIQL
jgi:hypothetical protein